MKIQAKTFPKGGVHPADNKLSSDQSIKPLPIPKTVCIPLSQHIGAPATPIVNIGDKVVVGQLIGKSKGFISANIHSSVSGTVKKIDKVLDVTGYPQSAITISVEGDQWSDTIDTNPDINRDIKIQPEDISKKIHAAGIVGLGGATFPSHVKLQIPEGKNVEYLLINGVECESYLTSDHRLMLEKGEEIIIGIQIILKALNLHKALIGIENNKNDAIAHLKHIAHRFPKIEVHALKMQYPQGGERQLIKAMTNREVPPPPKGLPIDVGCAVFNIGTVFAIYEAVQKNKPLIERVVTITGKNVKNPSNFLVRVGSSVSGLIEAAGGLPENNGKIISGGPMMGKALASCEVPITKGMSGIVLMDKSESSRHGIENCIRCAKCVSACPLGLEPYLVAAMVEKGHIDQAREERVLSCCECGCCVYICPAKRPLLDHLRLGKFEVMKNEGKKNNDK